MNPRVALVGGLLLLSAVAGVLTATSSPARDDKPAEAPLPDDFVRLVPPYPDARYHPSGDAQRRVAYAETDDSPVEVMQRYRSIFEGRGLDVADGMDGIMASGDGWLRTIVAQARGAGSLIVVSLRRDTPTPGEARLPVPTFCKRHDDASSTARSTTNLMCQGSSDQLVAYYESLMGGPPARVREDGLTKVMRYERDGEQLTISLAQQPGTPPRVSASLYWEARP